MPTVPCLFCNIWFEKRASQIKVRKKHFCSLGCANSYQQSFKKTYHQRCEECNKVSVVNSLRESIKKFCSHSCSAKFHNRLRVKHSCKLCNKPTHSSHLDFCSQLCKDQYLVWRWLDGQESGGTKYGYVKAFVRRYLEQRANNKCEQCPFDKVRPSDGRSILQVDHIDGDCMNHSVNNLRLLCPNCHAMTDTYCGKNKNSGRSWKKQYYSKVKA